MMGNEHTFKFRGKIYALTDKWEETSVNESKDFQLKQFEYLISVGDWVTMENRVINQIKFGYLKQI